MSRFSQIIACLALSVGCSTRGGSSTDATGGADALALLDNSVDGRASRPARDAAQAEQTSPDAGHVAFPARPNIILVYADDLGYGDLGSYGQSRISTPHLDRLAADGMRFTQFYSNCPYCYGARISMLTGQHLGASVRMREGFVADSPDAPRYLPRYLQNAGYATAIFGKWGFGSCDGLSFVGEKDPATVGFDVFLGYLTHRGAHTYTLPPYPLLPADTWAIDDHLWTIERGRTVEYPEARIPYTHELYVRETLAFIRSQQDRPFFLYLPYTLPHAELYVPDDAEDENLLGQYLGDDGKSIFPETPWRGDAIYRRPNERPRATYAAMVSRLDRDIGRIVAEVEALGLSEKTVIVVTSDNGPHEAGGIIGPEFFDSTGGLSGLKFTLREGGIRVPLIVYWPRSVEAGVVVTQPFAQEDLLPTFAELAGVAVTSPITGHSLVPLLRGASQEPHEFLYWQAVTNHFAGEAVRSGDWKAIRSGTDSSTDPVRLFDLVDDLREARDVAAENPALVAQLKRLMDRARTTAGGGPDGLYPITPFFSDRQQRTGTDGDDELGGSAEADEISGGDGADSISGLSGADLLNGNAGDDVVHGNEGDDIVRGGRDDDVVRGGQGDDEVYGDLGDDRVYGDLGADRVYGGAGNDVLYGGNEDPLAADGGDLIYGEEGNDTIHGYRGDDVIHGGPGRDQINGNHGDDTLHGDADDDVVRGGKGNDTIFGDDGDDTLYGDLGDDVLYGGRGDDVYVVLPGNGQLTIDDAAGRDTLRCVGPTVTSQVSRDGVLRLRLDDGGEILIVESAGRGAVEVITGCGL